MISTTSKLILGAILATAVVAGLGWVVYKVDRRATAIESDKWQAKVGKMKLQATQELLAATNERDALQSALSNALAAQERKDDEGQKTVARLENNLRSMRALSGGRMLDPNATGCRSGGQDANGKDSGAAIGGGGNAAEARGLLSTELTRLLDKLTREADDINVAYASCRADAVTIRALIQAQ